jgi:hypothetical protein
MIDEPFACLTDELIADSAISRTDRPGRASLRAHGRVFATDYRDLVVLRLPRARADEVVAAGLARHLDPGQDSLLGGWVVLGPADRESCGPLAREALVYARARYPG